MIDRNFQFCDAQSVNGNDQPSDYYADMTGGTQGKDAFGNSINIPVSAAKMFLNVLVTTAIATADCTVTLATDSATTITAAGSSTYMAELVVPSGAAAGEMFSVGVDMHSGSWERYVGVILDKGSAGPTGNVDVWLDVNPVTTQKLPR